MTSSFPTDYAAARQRFLEAARAAGVRCERFDHPGTGRDGEALALDIAIDGDDDGSDWLLLSSGCHGIEGPAGSALQAALLGDDERRRAARSAGITVLHLHALNPYGFSWQRRTTQENVDLNRNFHDFARTLPDNPGYRALHPLLVPPEWPPTPDNIAAVGAYLRTYGLPALKAATSRGQHEFPDGLFYGGTSPCWSHLALRQALRDRLTGARRIAWIDIHTGLGPIGVGERIFACRDDPAAYQRARRWWGDPITSIYDGSSTSSFLTGLMFEAIYAECPQAEYTGIALEFGTLPVTEVLNALRGDQWLANRQARGEATDPALAAAIRQQMLAAFHVDSPAWCAAVLAQGLAAVDAAVAGLDQTNPPVAAVPRPTPRPL